jgi:HEAT repeat protein
LERVCVALDLDALDRKDWYAWGTQLLLANQQDDGSWRGNFAHCGADTAFALLFLKKANLTRDLTRNLRGTLKDPAAAVLRAGGVGGAGLKKGTPSLKPAIETASDQPSVRLADELVRAPAAEQPALLDKLRDSKGVEYTEALTFAIARLKGDAQLKARAALAQRLGRMKAETLANYLRDEEPELRRAAAQACALKGLKRQIPNLIPLLRDREALVVRAAVAALKELTGQDLGPQPEAWEAWWKTQRKE